MCQIIKIINTVTNTDLEFIDSILIVQSLMNGHMGVPTIFTRRGHIFPLQIRKITMWAFSFAYQFAIGSGKVLN